MRHFILIFGIALCCAGLMYAGFLIGIHRDIRIPDISVNATTLEYYQEYSDLR